MSNILQSLSEPNLLRAIEVNLAEEMASFGRALPGGTVHEDTELVWFSSGQSLFNGVLLTNFIHDDKAYIDTKISKLVSYFQERNFVPAWSIGPTTRPANLAMYLEAHNFTYRFSHTGMAIEVRTAQSPHTFPAKFHIVEVREPEALQPLRTIETEAFGASTEVAELYYKTYVNLGFGEGKPWHHYIGWLNGKPVAIASLLFHAGVAGIYGVATLPDARHQGVGTAMTLHAIKEAAKKGYHVAILTPTEMSRNIYDRIGFQEFCKLHLYIWSPRP